MTDTIRSADQRAQDFDRIRAEMAASFDALREANARRMQEGRAGREHARQLLDSMRKRTQTRLGAPDTAGKETGPAASGVAPLPLEDLHLLERLVSHIRHSIVRVCFYNLKLFCPSLVDEFDAHVREQILRNVDELPGVRKELDTFFAQVLCVGEPIADRFSQARHDAFEALDRLIELAGQSRPNIDELDTRRTFAGQAPTLIDDVMGALQAIQSALDTRKLDVAAVARQAVALAEPLAAQAGITIHFGATRCPRLFGDRERLLGAFTELIANAAKYSGGGQLHVCAAAIDKNRNVQVTCTDYGKGMTKEETRACVHRGATTGGTGEGLPMVIQVVEEEHFGRFTMDSPGPGKGCRATVVLPAKLERRTNPHE